MFLRKCENALDSVGLLLHFMKMRIVLEWGKA